MSQLVLALRQAMTPLAAAVGQGGRALVRTSLGLIRSILTLDPLRVYKGTMRPRQMWVAVKVLSDRFGPLLSQAHDPDQPETVIRQDHWADLSAAIDEARRIFREQANVVLQPGDNSEMIDVIGPAAPEFALNVGCNGRAYREGLSKTGKFFEEHSQARLGGIAGRAPVTVFIVANLQGKSGCSLGPLTDYVTVDLGGLIGGPGDLGHASWTLTHELGHACNLWHHGDTLMRPAPVGRHDHLQRWQRVLLRASSHVTRA